MTQHSYANNLLNTKTPLLEVQEAQELDTHV